MKKNLTNFLLGFGIASSAIAQTVATGPSSSQSPYILPVIPGYSVTSILTASDVVNGYTLSGIPDGAGAWDNNDGTISMIINHEIPSNSGVVRAHGSTGAFVTKLRINKTTLAVTNAVDLITNVKIWNPATSTYSTFNITNPSTLSAMGRFCSADLAPISAFYNSATGRGTQERLFLNGEEIGSEGRAFAHIATGVNAGTTYELPFLGNLSYENAVASPKRSDKTIVIGLDDSSPGQVYVYVGNKSSIGTEIDKAGLNGGTLYGIAVAGLVTETNTLVIAPNTSFSLTNLGNVQAMTGASLNTISNNLGVTNFLRPEDGAWDPSNPRDFYFCTTNGFGNPSRVWRLRFTDIENPHLGGQITAVLDGTEGQQMIDNFCIDNSGHIILQEDVGNNAHIGKMWEYTIATDALVQITTHDSNRFLTGAPNFLTQDEEASGILDAQALLGPGKFLLVDQAHYSIPGMIFEGGQVLLLSSLNTATSNPEINVTGNAINIPSGNATTGTNNNTAFGALNVGTSVNKAFVVQNTGTGTLNISYIDFSGTNAGDFTLVNPPILPILLAPNASQTLTIKYAPVLVGASAGTLNLFNNDFDEPLYDFAIVGSGVVPEINVQGNNNNIPAGNTILSAIDNTDFGSITYFTSVSKTFVIQNTGSGTLTLNNISISGVNASEFTIQNSPTFPLTMVGGSSISVTVQFLPIATGTRSAKILITNSDTDEPNYDFEIRGISLLDVGLNKIASQFSTVSLFPNPAKDEAVLKLNHENGVRALVKVFDITGKIVLALPERLLEKGESQIKLNTTNLKDGEYFILIDTNQKSSVVKLIIHR